jgi:hypothetical protein
VTLESRIAQLTDQQALSIVDSISGEFAADGTPAERAEQKEALQSALAEGGHAVELDEGVEPDPAEAAAAARELLRLMAEVPELRPSVEEWLDDPPTQEAAALPLILAAPVVFAGCIVMLQIAGHARFKRSADGKWEFEYDPARRAPLDDVMKQMVGPLAKLMGKLAGPGT